MKSVEVLEGLRPNYDPDPEMQYSTVELIIFYSSNKNLKKIGPPSKKK